MSKYNGIHRTVIDSENGLFELILVTVINNAPQSPTYDESVNMRSGSFFELVVHQGEFYGTQKVRSSDCVEEYIEKIRAEAAEIAKSATRFNGVFRSGLTKETGLYAVSVVTCTGNKEGAGFYDQYVEIEDGSFFEVEVSYGKRAGKTLKLDSSADVHRVVTSLETEKSENEAKALAEA